MRLIAMIWREFESIEENLTCFLNQKNINNAPLKWKQQQQKNAATTIKGPEEEWKVDDPPI